MLKHIAPEPTSVDNYLLDLRDELSGQMPEHKLDEILAETESHLRERAEAFEELGLGNPEAEAVRAFVQTSTYAAEMSDSAVSDRLAENARRWQRWAINSLPFVGPATLWTVWPGIPIEALFVLGSPLLLAVVAALAFVGRRPQTQRIVALGALSAALAFGYFGAMWVESENFCGPRREAQLQSLTWTNMAEGHRERLQEMDLARWIYMQENPQVPPRFRRLERYVIPPLRTFDESDATSGSLAAATDHWRGRGASWLGHLRSNARRYYEAAEGYQKALEGPPFRTGIAGRAGMLSIAFALLVLLTDLLMARLGEALFWRRRNRKRSKLGSA
jgi:hypothetical protein